MQDILGRPRSIPDDARYLVINQYAAWKKYVFMVACSPPTKGFRYHVYWLGPKTGWQSSNTLSSAELKEITSWASAGSEDGYSI